MKYQIEKRSYGILLRLDKEPSKEVKKRLEQSGLVALTQTKWVGKCDMVALTKYLERAKSISKQVNQSRIYRDTLCWHCKNACGLCNWSGRFKPVEGWDATPLELRISNKKTTNSYHVRRCPQFKKG